MHLWGAKKKKKEKYHSITSLISLSALFLSFSWFHSPSMPCTYFLSFFPYGNCECLASSVHGGESQVRISVTVESHKERGCWAELGTDIVSRILPSKLYLTEFSAYSRARSPRVFFFFFLNTIPWWTTEDEMAGLHYRLSGHEFGWTPGVGDGQGGLACCDSWGFKELDTTEQLNWTDCDQNIMVLEPKKKKKKDT